MQFITISWGTLSISLLLQILGVISHDASLLDWVTVNSRTCPYESDMEQRLAKFSELIYLVSNDVPFGATQSSWDNTLENYIFDQSVEFHAVVFPNTISESQSYFTAPAFAQDLLDMSKHSSWYSLDYLLDGGGASGPQPDEYYGEPSDLSFWDFLKTLGFGVKIVNGISYYYCDEHIAWGFNQANVYIKEKLDPLNTDICKPKTYVGTAEVYSTFTKIINAFGNDEWILDEWAVFWDIYAERDAQLCDTQSSSSSSSSGTSSSSSSSSGESHHHSYP